MDVQADAALEAMAETGSAAEGATSPSSFAAASSSQSSSNSSPSGSASLPPGAAGGTSPQKKLGLIPQQGYPKEIMDREVEEKFLCGYCENILREPMQSECGHRFCNCCRIKMQQMPQPVICQGCVQEEMPEESCILNLAAMFDDKAAIREMRKIPSKCINPGCTWKGTFHEYISSHEISCDKKMLACSLCGSEMSQNKLLNHESNQCPKRLVTCQYCQQQMIHEQLEKHQMACPLVPIKCDKCSTSVPRNEFQNHQDRDCIHRDVICPVPDCHKKMSKEKFPSHLNESPKMTQKHLLYLFDRIGQLEQELARIQIQPPPVALDREQGVAASAEGAGARSQQDSLDGSRGGQQKDHGAVGGAESAAVSEPQAIATLKLHEDLMSVLHGEILRCIRQVEAITAGRVRETTTVRDLQGKLQNLERSIGTLEVRLKEIQLNRLPITPTEVGTLAECGEGSATWCIPQFSQVRRATVNGTPCFVDSPPFMTGSLGYKMRMRLYPDGDGSAKGEALSVYLQLLPGPCDDLLPWPFKANIHFVLVDQKDFKQHKFASIHSPHTEPSCKQPTFDAEHLSQPSFGVEDLVTLREMGSELSRYSAKDNLYLRVLVDLKLSQVPDRLKSLDPRLRSTNFRRPDRGSSKN